jgi:4-amino-4-deoxy-L-arabinose transferase-like glycosyltransferase
MSRLPPWLVIIAVWAAIYLPALGSFEIKGEEGRRILPAMAMLEQHDYLVPRVGGQAYFTKPPLVNWLVAASFKAFGRNEWSARIPSAVSVLIAALVFVTIGSASLGRGGAMAAALIWLTTIGLIEKGRLIEIDALYVSLCAIAIICWLTWWQQNRSPWLTWIVPWIFLGLGWLAKGPLHLVFFYAVVLAVLWQSKEWKALFHPAHFVGILLMLAIFASWAVPFLHSSGQSRGLNKWSAQFTGRINPGLFNVGTSALTLIRAIGQFLPWILFVPFLRLDRFRDARERQLAARLAWSAVVPVLAISAVPVAAPRYSLPALAPFCWLLGLSFARDAFAHPRWLGSTGQPLWERFGRLCALLVVMSALVGFPIAARLAKKHEKVKNVAAQVNAVVPATETLFAIDPGYQPFLFYVQARVRYVEGIERVPASARYMVVRPNREAAVGQSERWAPRHAQPVVRVRDYRGETVILFLIDEERP